MTELLFLDATTHQCFGSKADTGRNPTGVVEKVEDPGPGFYDLPDTSVKNPFQVSIPKGGGFTVVSPRFKSGEAMPGVSVRKGEPGPGTYEVDHYSVGMAFTYHGHIGQM